MSALNPDFGVPDFLPVTDFQEGMFPNVPVSEDEAREIVRKCTQFKLSARNHAQQKKEIMRTCYGYNKQKFMGNDLLPRPSTSGNERDANTGRPQVFVPVIRQEVKRLYSQLKLTLFPNDEDFFRVRSKTQQGAEFEDALTEGLKHIFRDMQLTERLAPYLQDLPICGNGVVLPTIEDEIRWEYAFRDAEFEPVMDPETGEPVMDPVLDPETGEPMIQPVINPMTGEPLVDPETGMPAIQPVMEPRIEMVLPARYETVPVEIEPKLGIQRLDPLEFYIEPNVGDPDKAKWVYSEIKKFIEIKDSSLYFNKDRLESHLLSKKDSSPDTRQSKHDINDINSQFDDIEDSVKYDLYYMPYMRVNDKDFRNMIIGVVDNQVLVRFHPNMFPRGMNPCVFTTWMDDPDSPYGTGPAEDIKEVQRLLNIIFNYLVETLARIGNRFVVPEGTDMSNLFGIAGGAMTMEDPRAFVAITGDYTEPAFLLNLIGMIKADAQITAGSQNPFQGASNIDFQKTATELQILHENAITILREVIEHIAITGVARILERLMYLAADLHSEPIELRVDDPIRGKSYISVDFSLLRSGDYTIELTNINPSQSRQQQIDTLLRVYELAKNDPDLAPYLKNGGFEWLKKVLTIMGERDFDTYLKSPAEVLEELRQHVAMEQGQQGIPAEEAGMGAGADPAMAGIDQALAGAEGQGLPLDPQMLG